jgi:hypothetical protein
MTHDSEGSGLRVYNTTPANGVEIKSELGAAAGFLYVFRGHGPFTHNLGFTGITPNSALAVTVTEIDRPDATGKPFIGNAAISIANVAPGTNAVNVHGLVDFGTDLNYRITVASV